ncbi:MAG: prepilin-type N-terminal cleavage/methylation domain-containing protein [Clostridia bacterium]|nr:prepilin-type N-terminal cleavage/methylation domain-containing protein [Clostridia bacterium]
MKKTNKKGFTIVELVIVIAIIAVLAAVLIPTFAGVIKKANLAADQRAVQQMTEKLEIANAEKAPANLDELIDILAAAGFNAEDTLVPVSTGHAFFWSETANKLFLAKVDGETITEVVFPAESETLKDGTVHNLKGGYKYVDIAATDAKSLESALIAGNEKIKLEADLTLKSETMIAAGANVTLDLNGKTLTTAETTGRHKYLNVDAGATLTITNGTAALRGVGVYGKVVVGEGATIQSIDDNGGASLWVYAGGEVVIDGGTFVATGGDYSAENTDIQYEPGVINNAGTVTINGGTFEALNSGCYAINNSGTLVINGGTFKALRGVVASAAGSVTINGGDFEVTGGSGIGLYSVYASNGTVAVNGGTFDSTSYDFCVDSAGTGSITIAAAVTGGDAVTLNAGQSR